MPFRVTGMKKAKERTFSSLAVGDSVTIEHTIQESDIEGFAQVSGDYNPLHTDETFAEGTEFKKRVVHGMFLGGLVSQLVGMQLPGVHALLIKETLEFKKPLFIGDTVRLLGSIVSKSEATRLIEIEISAERGTDTVAAGRVIVRVLK